MTTTENRAEAAPDQPQESRMRRTKQTTKTKSRTPVKAKTTAAAKDEKGPRAGSKLEIIAKLLARKNGCTAKDVMEETGWPSVSLPQQAKALGVTLAKEKIDGVTHYKIAS